MSIGNLVNVSIPAIAVVMGLLLVIFALYLRFKREREEQATMRTAIEKGVEIPKEFFTRSRSHACVTADSCLRRGILWTAVGIAVVIALWWNEGPHTAAWGFIPLAAGLGLLIYSRVAPRS